MASTCRWCGHVAFSRRAGQWFGRTCLEPPSTCVCGQPLRNLWLPPHPALDVHAVATGSQRSSAGRSDLPAPGRRTAALPPCIHDCCAGADLSADLGSVRRDQEFRWCPIGSARRRRSGSGPTKAGELLARKREDLFSRAGLGRRGCASGAEDTYWATFRSVLQDTSRRTRIDERRPGTPTLRLLDTVLWMHGSGSKNGRSVMAG